MLSAGICPIGAATISIKCPMPLFKPIDEYMVEYLLFVRADIDQAVDNPHVVRPALIVGQVRTVRTAPKCRAARFERMRQGRPAVIFQREQLRIIAALALRKSERNSRGMRRNQVVFAAERDRRTTANVVAAIYGIVRENRADNACAVI